MMRNESVTLGAAKSLAMWLLQRIWDHGCITILSQTSQQMINSLPENVSVKIPDSIRSTGGAFRVSGGLGSTCRIATMNFWWKMVTTIKKYESLWIKSSKVSGSNVHKRMNEALEAKKWTLLQWMESWNHATTKKVQSLSFSKHRKFLKSYDWARRTRQTKLALHQILMDPGPGNTFK